MEHFLIFSHFVFVYLGSFPISLHGQEGDSNVHFGSHHAWSVMRSNGSLKAFHVYSV